MLDLLACLQLRPGLLEPVLHIVHRKDLFLLDDSPGSGAYNVDLLVGNVFLKVLHRALETILANRLLLSLHLLFILSFLFFNFFFGQVDGLSLVVGLLLFLFFCFHATGFLGDGLGFFLLHFGLFFLRLGLLEGEQTLSLLLSGLVLLHDLLGLLGFLGLFCVHAQFFLQLQR